MVLADGHWDQKRFYCCYCFGCHCCHCHFDFYFHLIHLNSLCYDQVLFFFYYDLHHLHRCYYYCYYYCFRFRPRHYRYHYLNYYYYCYHCWYFDYYYYHSDLEIRFGPYFDCFHCHFYCDLAYFLFVFLDQNHQVQLSVFSLFYFLMYQCLELVFYVLEHLYHQLIYVVYLQMMLHHHFYFHFPIFLQIMGLFLFSVVCEV